ncbi:MAG: hypothetical protein H6P94_673 [Thermoplasmatales archaeon]|jgi:uncharacterized membrane protein|nr:hypothetical protein [Thermoplasmatales archaeon]
MLQDSPTEKLTTAVFGFALAVGALSLTKANPETIMDVVGSLVLFSLSFIILVVIWWGTSEIMSKINQSNPVTVLLNIVLLFFVAIEPYLLNILNANVALFPLSSTLYAMDMAFLMGVSAALSQILLKENKTTLTPQQLRYFRIGRNNQFICSCLFFLSCLPWFLDWTIGGLNVRVLIWFATLAFTLIISSRKRYL